MISVVKQNRAAPSEYMGLSTDEKPADATVNSLFLELDTGDFYYFDGEDWQEIPE